MCTCAGTQVNINIKYYKCDLIKAWQSAINNILSRNVDWRDWRAWRDWKGGSLHQYCAVFSELLEMELDGHRYVRPTARSQFIEAGQKTLDTFIKQFFRKSQEASELAPTQEDET